MIAKKIIKNVERKSIKKLISIMIKQEKSKSKRNKKRKKKNIKLWIK